VIVRITLIAVRGRVIKNLRNFFCPASGPRGFFASVIREISIISILANSDCGPSAVNFAYSLCW